VSHVHDHDADHGSVYDGLAGGSDSQWAFGSAAPDQQGDDLASGVAAPVPDGVDAGALAAYSLMLADDALVYSHRLSEWAGTAPDLEEDIALANIALDLLGQARMLLARAAVADPSVVPRLPDGSPVPGEDALAFFRDERAFRNVRLVEPDNGDFAVTVARLLVFSTYRLALLQRLIGSRDSALSAIAAKGVREVAYHRDYAGRWFLTLAKGTDESHRRLVAGLQRVWPAYEELFSSHPVEDVVAAEGVGVDPAAMVEEVGVLLDDVFALSGIERPAVPAAGAVNGGTGRDGRHTEALGRLLAEMQVVARAHPRGLW
jgi:ring-1,2-phenylacetyl-CoA epoxidase subunit PaaC